MPLTLSGKALAAGEDGRRFLAKKPAASALRLTMSGCKVSGIERTATARPVILGR